jgi:hypothetical protein
VIHGDTKTPEDDKDREFIKEGKRRGNDNDPATGYVRKLR